MSVFRIETNEIALHVEGPTMEVALRKYLRRVRAAFKVRLANWTRRKRLAHKTGAWCPNRPVLTTEVVRAEKVSDGPVVR